MKKIVVIGLGKQSIKDHIDAIIACDAAMIEAVCDNNVQIAKKVGKELSVPTYTSIDKLLENHKPDAAVVAVPHACYFDIVKILIEAGVHVLKEKPLDINLEKALRISKLAEKNKLNLSVAVQRRHNKIYNLFEEYRAHIGEVFSVHGEYTLNINDLSEDWRSKKELAGGGAIIDMGYHMIDLIVWYFDIPDRISADLGFHNRSEQDYDVEDTAKVQFSYKAPSDRRILGSMLLSRIYPSKDESLSIYGGKGAIKIYKDRIELYNRNREVIESSYFKSNGEDTKKQFDDFIKQISEGNFDGNHRQHLKDMVFIDAIYKSNSENRMVLPKKEKAYSDVLAIIGLENE